MHDVRFLHPAGRIVHMPDSSGLTIATSSEPLNSDGGELPPPKLTKEIIAWLASQRLHGNDQMIGLQSEMQAHRLTSMLQRQRSAAKQVRLASKLSELLAHEIQDDDSGAATNIRRLELVGSRRARPSLWHRMGEMQRLLADFRPPGQRRR